MFTKPFSISFFLLYIRIPTMDKKSLEKMIRSIMGDLKSEAKEDHFSDSDGNSKQFFLSKCFRCICKICYSLLEPQPSTSSGRGLPKNL